MNSLFPKSSFEHFTLVELLRWRATDRGEQRAYTFLLDGESEESYLTYKELDRQARAIAALLQSYGSSGERVLLLYPPGLEFIAAFFGCLYAGWIGVPAYPPQLNRPNPRLQAIIADTEAKIALTTAEVISNLERRLVHTPDLEGVQWLASDRLTPELAEDWRSQRITSDTLAFLQYTSGSTAAPKGAMVSHGNILHNQKLIQQGFEHTEQSSVVGWLPFFHDMGLIGNILQPLYVGIPCILMPPVAFLQRPWRWLQAISKYRATTSGGPNFAYDLCVRKVMEEQKQELDLSCWNLAFNGAEPVRAETMERFAAAFAGCGFKLEAFYPCYGMAETTLIVSGGMKAAKPVFKTVREESLGENLVVPSETGKLGSWTVVGCGKVLGDLQVAIANPETLCRCGNSQVGEIWVAGQSIARGYWQQPDVTAKTFDAYLADTGEGPFLRTGDLGFLDGDELFITGRLKDLIIIRGRNYYPNDIELTVEKSHPALLAAAGAAFVIEKNEEERMVVVQEVERQSLRRLDVDGAIANIRQAVLQHHQLLVNNVVLVKPGSIPKTSSGKIQRFACKAAFLKGDLNSINLTLPSSLSCKEREG
jgi:acyl-CoA synthetase (AMP-forming)/AMP-acid ligase II